MQKIEFDSDYLTEAEWAALPDEEQLNLDPQRVMYDLGKDEQLYAESANERSKWFDDEIPQAQETPSRVSSPTMAHGSSENVRNQEQPTSSEVEEDEDSEVNTHLEGHEFDPIAFREHQQVARVTHRLPGHLVGVRTCHWFGTHNSEEYMEVDELKEACDNLVQLLQWVIIYKEIAPTTNHVHYHSLVVYKKPALAHYCIEIDPRASWEKVRGQLKTAFNYIRKDNNKYFEWGVMPNNIMMLLEKEEVKERKRKQPTKTDEEWKAAVTRAKRGDISIRDEKVYARHMMYFDQILASIHKDERYDDDLKCKNLWICGPPGTGKSRLVWDYAQAENLTIYVKLQNKWWDGYNGQKIVLIDDAGDNMKVLASHIKNWADRYPFTAEVKGGTRRINSKDFHLIITSNYSIREIFNGVDSEAIERRFDILEMK